MHNFIRVQPNQIFFSCGFSRFLTFVAVAISLFVMIPGKSACAMSVLISGEEYTGFPSYETTQEATRSGYTSTANNAEYSAVHGAYVTTTTDGIDVEATSNTAEVNNSTIGNLAPSVPAVTGGYTTSTNGSATANGNAAKVIGSTFENLDVSGGYAESLSGNAIANGNTAKVIASDKGKGVHGGHANTDSGNATASENKVFFDGTSIKNIRGGWAGSFSGNVTANGNEVIMESGTVDDGTGGGLVSGGYALSGSGERAIANTNKVTVNGGTLYEINGGYASTNGGNSVASENEVIVNGNDGTLQYIRGGYAFSQNGDATADKNTVTLNAGRLGDVYGGYATSGNGNATANDNTVVLKGRDLTIQTVYGGFAKSTSGVTTTKGNTLEVWSQGITVKSLQNFENFLFVLPQEALSQDKSATPMLLVEEAVKMDGASIAVTVGNDVIVTSGDKAVLIDKVDKADTLKTVKPSELKKSDGTFYATANADGTYTVKGGDITEFINGDILLNVDANKLVATFKNVKANDNAKAVAEGQVANMALLTQGSNLVAGEAMQSALDSVVQAKKSKTTGGVGFGAISGGYSRYDTGSYVKLSSFEFIAGYAQSTKAFSQSKLTVGGFLEAGYGDYDTHTNDVRGDGKSRYVGVGILTQLGESNDFGPYGEFSFRLGRASNDWDGPRGMKTDFSNFYCGSHIGLGYRGDLSDGYVVDFYGKGFWTHQNGKDALVKGSEFKFDDIDSLKTRIGIRVTNRETSGFMPYIGLAWDHEFTAKAKASVNGIAVDAPDIKGDITLAEAGFTYRPTEKSNWKLTVKASGYTGVRKGITGHVLFESRF